MSWTTFHQKEELTTRIKNILDEYPPGIGPFKEFIQNADDSGAKKFILKLDTKTYGTDSVISHGLGAWQVHKTEFPIFFSVFEGTCDFGL